MSSNEKRYTEELKKQIIEGDLSGTSVSSLAEEYGIAMQTIYKWEKFYAPSAKVEEDKEISLKEIKELQKKIRQLDLENEILNKSRGCIHKFSLEEIDFFLSKS